MKKHYKIGMLLAAILLAGCVQAPAENIHSDNPTKTTYQELDQGTAQENLEANEDILLIDVRTPEEFEEKRIPNSILVPDYDIDKLAPEILPDKDAQIYLYCRSGAVRQQPSLLIWDIPRCMILVALSIGNLRLSVARSDESSEKIYSLDISSDMLAIIAQS